MIDSVDNERGQVLVLVALMVIVLLVFVGLAVDGGTAIVERRKMQNAADAAALAGAHRLISAVCGSESATTADAAIWAQVVEYARKNGVQETSRIAATYVKFDGDSVVQCDPTEVVGAGSVPNGAVGVAVTTGIERDTYFMKLIGIDTSDAQAPAIAVTGPPLTAGGLRPYGVPSQIIQDLEFADDKCFTSYFGICKEGTDPTNPCYIRTDAGDPIVPHRGWLNLNHMWNCTEEASGFPRATGSSANADDLADWMANGFDRTIYADCEWYGPEHCGCGDFIHAQPGGDESVIGATPIDVVFTIPIFDVVRLYDEIPDPKAGAVAAGGSYYYHIVGFASVTVGPGDAPLGGHTIRACLTQTVWGSAPPKPNPGFGNDVCAGGTMVVTLWQ